MIAQSCSCKKVCVHAPDVMLQVIGGGFHGAQSPDPAAEAANKGVGRLQARHGSGVKAFHDMPGGIKGRQLAAGTSHMWQAKHTKIGK
jgi:hypothetical protein